MNQKLLETPMTLKSLGLAGIVVAAFASPAFAHHSFAMFDADTKMTVEGVVKEFQWTNPHAWIMLTVADRAQRPERLGAAGLEAQDPDARHARHLDDPSAQGRNPWRPVHGGQASGRNAARQSRRPRARHSGPDGRRDAISFASTSSPIAGQGLSLLLPARGEKVG
jgi:hypothetical protein